MGGGVRLVCVREAAAHSAGILASVQRRARSAADGVGRVARGRVDRGAHVSQRVDPDAMAVDLPGKRVPAALSANRAE